jgi:hypothetical protein
MHLSFERQIIPSVFRKPSVQGVPSFVSNVGQQNPKPRLIQSRGQKKHGGPCIVTKVFFSGSTAPTVCVAHHSLPRSLERPNDPAVESGMLPARYVEFSRSWVARGQQSDRGNRGVTSLVARATMWLAQKNMGPKRSGSGLVQVEPDQ